MTGTPPVPVPSRSPVGSMPTVSGSGCCRLGWKSRRTPVRCRVRPVRCRVRQKTARARVRPPRHARVRPTDWNERRQGWPGRNAGVWSDASLLTSRRALTTVRSSPTTRLLRRHRPRRRPVLRPTPCPALRQQFLPATIGRPVVHALDGTSRTPYTSGVPGYERRPGAIPAHANTLGSVVEPISDRHGHKVTCRMVSRRTRPDRSAGGRTRRPPSPRRRCAQ